MIKINLLPKTLRKRVEPGWWRIIAIAFPLLVLGGILITQLGLSNTLRAETEHRDQLKTEVETLQQYIDGKNRLATSIQALTETQGIQTQLEQNQIKWSDDIFNFAKLLPRNGNNTSVRLESMNMRRYDTKTALGGAAAYDGQPINKEIIIQGKAKTSDDIVKFLKAFEKDNHFKAQLNQADKNKEKGVYTFSANVGVIGEAAPATASAPVTGGAAAPTTPTSTTTPATTTPTTPGAAR